MKTMTSQEVMKWMQTESLSCDKPTKCLQMTWTDHFDLHTYFLNRNLKEITI